MRARVASPAEGSTIEYDFVDADGNHVSDLVDIESPEIRSRRRVVKPNADFAQASKRLIELREEYNNTGLRLDQKELSIKQHGLLFQAEKDPKSLLGTRVIVLSTEEMVFSSSQPVLIGVIVDVQFDAPNKTYRFNVEAFRAGQRRGWPLEYLYLWQIEQLGDEFKASTEDLAKLKIEKLLAQINQSKNIEYQKKERSISDYKNRIRSYQADIENYKITLEKTEKELETIKLNNLDFKGLEEKFKELKKHDKLDDAWLTTNNTIYFRTKMLMPISRAKQKEGKKELGRFLIRVSYNEGNRSLTARNLDYQDSGSHDHPNISGGQICSGSHEPIFADFIKNFELYGLFDSLITFLTIWPHDSGANPYVSFTSWKRSQRKVLNENPYSSLGEERLWPKIEK